MDPATAASLLRHLGLDPAAPPPATRAGLRAVHRAFVSRVPYEALSVQLGRCGPLDEEELAGRILSGRGGYCFEVNTVLAGLLRALGFELAMHQALVGGDGPTNHMALIVDLGEQGRWIADAGLGEGALDPLPLMPGTSGPPPFTWRVEERADDWSVASHPYCSFAGFRIEGEPSPLSAFAPHHARLSTTPDSSFVQTLVVQRPGDDQLTTLRARTLSTVTPDATTKRILADAADFESTLHTTFGIPPHALTDAQRARLWRQASEQHDAYVARRGVGGTTPAP
ncbi:MAG TPA: arylamine N-acetyltransferase [Solirubrobacteraceae bacterium]|nr:arylamine N-acetyltransferase [Solirubrobacteraceae bacterium]